MLYKSDSPISLHHEQSFGQLSSVELSVQAHTKLHSILICKLPVHQSGEPASEGITMTTHWIL